MSVSLMAGALQLEEFRKGRLEENAKGLSGPFSRSTGTSLFFSEDYGCPSHFLNPIPLSFIPYLIIKKLVYLISCDKM